MSETTTPTPAPALTAAVEADFDTVRSQLGVDHYDSRGYAKACDALNRIEAAITAALSQGAADAARMAGRERDAAFDVARVAHWLLNDSGYTKRHAARALADIARGLHRETAEQALGDAARAGEASHG